MNAWCIVSPKGKLYPWTCCQTQKGAWLLWEQVKGGSEKAQKRGYEATKVAIRVCA